MKLKTASIGVDKPLKDILLPHDQLLAHAAEIARTHGHGIPGVRRRWLLPRVKENMLFLAAAHREINAYLKETRDMIPAAEWFLDNYYLLKDLYQDIRHNLPPRYERQLPVVPAGKLIGFPRVFALMVELIEHTDSNPQGETLKDFINAYQEEVPLSSGELWAIPIMLRIALLENIRRLVEQVLYTQRERQEAERWLEPFIHMDDETARWEEALKAAELKEEYSSAYAERLLKRIRDLGLDVAPVLHWLDRALAKQDTTAENLAKLEHQRQAMYQVSMGHAILGLRFIREEDWPKFFEEISAVEKVLRQDPGGVYTQMDFESRDRYRHQVEKISRRYRVSELAVARMVLDLAEKTEGADPLVRHVGYYLVGKGCKDLQRELEKEWGSLRRICHQVRILVREHPTTTYFSGMLLGTVSILIPLLNYATNQISPWGGRIVLAAVASLLPAAGIAVTLVNWLVTRMLPPTFFPKLELPEGIPAHLRTMVVIPTLLTGKARVQEILEQMEVYYLANQDKHLHFALLGDYGDAPAEEMPGDQELIAAATQGIERLNRQYGADRFYFFHRKRLWNEREGTWMGWERKRGKLLEFNRLILGSGPTSYTVKVGELSILPKVRYVITLDSDTQLPRGAAKKLVGTMAHPLHTPRLSPDGKRVMEGYGLLQPRIGVSVLATRATLFTRLFAGQGGIDPYTTAVSDVYQDLFGEGSFTGKGIYDVATFHQVTEGAFPENTILSHDLLEGLYARTGLVTDIQLIDGYPAKYLAYARRSHRWIRGDWQILRWLFANLPLVAKWKIFDNLRRSLDAPAQILLIFLGFTVLPGSPWVWTCLVILELLLPVIITLANQLLNPHASAKDEDLRENLLQCIVRFVFLPFQAYLSMDAITRSLIRLGITRRKLLEWETAADTERRLQVSIGTCWQEMWPAQVLTLVLWSLIFFTNPVKGLAALPLAVLWLASPWLAYWLSLPRQQQEEELSPQERAELGRWARKIWAFFEDFVTAEENWLPPDNVQIDPPKGVAHRTSPTNIGLALLANLAAYDFGYITLSQACERIKGTLGTLDKLVRWKGHFYNWYDTLSLEPLNPPYVSTVDSGNLVVYLLTLHAGLEEAVSKPLLNPAALQGLQQTYELYLGEPADVRPELEAFGLELAELSRGAVTLESWYKFLTSWVRPLAELTKGQEFWGRRLAAMVASLLQELTLLYPWATSNVEQSVPADLWVLDWNLSPAALAAQYGEMLKDRQYAAWHRQFAQGLKAAKDLLKLIRGLGERLEAMAMVTDFRPLYDERLQLFSIGYRVADQALDKSYYDLLASEARQASYVAIAKGDVPQSHWFRLGRTLTKVNEKRSLVSWSGTMFEFLMPLLVMRNFPDTLIDETYRSVVEVQRRYGVRRNIPWGISESGFYAFDAQLNYQYKAFGVPGLGLKRGLVQDLVIAPYATFLALMVAPRTGLQNLKAMEDMGFGHNYGLFEAVDFTPERVSAGKKFHLVQSFMAHHQGMSFISLNNVLNGNIMQRRFHASPMIQAAELMLQERVPASNNIQPPPEEKLTIWEHKEAAAPEGRRFVTLQTVDSPIPVPHFLSNGQYAVMLTNSGSGFSRWGDTAISRWREDTTRDPWGFYVYIQNLNSGSVWSAAHQPCGYSGEDYKVTYAADRVEYCRKDGNIATRTEIVVSPEDQVEVRRISLTNYSQHSRTLELTTYFEVVLARPNEDLAHPAFGNLFVQTDFVDQSLLATRRPRRQDQKALWLMHTVAVEGEEVGFVQYETDRSKFIGRGRSLAKPKALDPNQPLSNSVGVVLDPIMSLRQRVKVKPGQTVRVSFSVGIGESREEVLRLAEKYKDLSTIERVFEMAWTYSQMQLRHLSLTPSQANDALSLGGNLLYLSPCRRDLAETIAQNRKGQSSLWPYAISGDLPVALARVKSSEHLDLVRQLLTIHEYWRLKGLVVDLVILNEDESGYLQALQDTLRDLVSMGHGRELLNRPGGIFLLQKSIMPPEDVTLLLSVSRLIFTGEGGSCTVQVRTQRKRITAAQHQEESNPLRQRTKETAAWQREYGLGLKPLANLQFANGYGGFSEDGREYIIELQDGQTTPLPWINVVANPSFGFQVSESGGGYTWSSNSREHKLTPWSNDPVLDTPGEVLYLRDEDTGEFWSATPAPIREKHRYRIRHGRGYSVFEQESHGLVQQLQMFVPMDKPVKIVELTLRNLSQEERRLSAFYYAELVIGVARELTAPYLVTEFDSFSGSLMFRNTYQEEFAGRIGFLSAAGGETVSYTGDRGEFIGRNRSLEVPLAMAKEQLSRTVGAGLDPCGALQLALTLGPGEEKTLYFLFGETAGREEARTLISEYRNPAMVQSALTRVKEFWRNLLDRVRVQTPDQSMNLLLNGWLLYQAVVCRLWARSAFYQSGGAYGFRDQLQDVMAVVNIAPEWSRQQILLHCAHQFTDGDVQHWWHLERSKGIRTKFSDDLLWLPFVTAYYLERTGDYSILDEQVSFLEDAPLGPEEDERYSVPKIAAEQGTVYEHCVRAIERGLRFGEHGLPLIGSGDWNDGFSRIGIKGKGESVWLGWFLYATLKRFSAVCAYRGDTQRKEGYRKKAEELLANLELHGWDGGWYRRAYFDDGTPLGSRTNDECQIDAIAQSWAVLSGGAKPSRMEDAMEALEHYLWRKEAGILLLLTPSFDQSKLDPGYIKGYVPGVRENGGQYTHGAVWAVLALCEMGKGDRAMELFHMLNPINHARTKHEADIYKVEPYVMAADVYAIEPHVGRGGWTWYTGAAGWMYQAGMEGILGFRVQGDKLLIKPCIPKHWPGYSIDYRYKNTLYRIIVENPQGKMTGVNNITLDGAAVEGVHVSLTDDGRTHEVRITM